jgi:lipoprotein-releasing system permease protein
MPFLFAWRYFKAKKSTQAIHVIAGVCVAAIAVGAAALILILSAFNGFEGLVKSLYASFYTDIRIIPSQGKTITLTEDQFDLIRRVNGVDRLSRIAEEKALIQNGDYQTIVQLKGVDEGYTKVTGVAEKMYNGVFRTGTAQAPALVLGAGIENALAVNASRNLLPLSVYMVKRTKENQYNPLDPPLPGSAQTAGTFLIQQDFDNKYVITHIDFVRSLMGLDSNEYTGVEIKIENSADPTQVKKQLSALLGNTFLVQTRYEQNQSLFSIMNLEKWVIYGILTLIMIIASFNIVGTLMMLVLEKEKDIQLLQSLGASDHFIRRIFLWEGLLLAAAGSAIGLLLAGLLCWIQITFKVIPLQGGSFIIDYYPVQMQWLDFVLVLLTIFIIALLAAWVPAQKAAKTKKLI